MCAYRANVTDKEQGEVEAAANDSAIRVESFDGGEQQVGQTKMVKAYDAGNAQAPNGTGATSVVRTIPGSGSSLGSHNDKPAVFETPGKA